MNFWMKDNFSPAGEIKYLCPLVYKFGSNQQTNLFILNKLLTKHVFSNNFRYNVFWWIQPKLYARGQR